MDAMGRVGVESEAGLAVPLPVMAAALEALDAASVLEGRVARRVGAGQRTERATRSRSEDIRKAFAETEGDRAAGVSRQPNSRTLSIERRRDAGVGFASTRRCT